MFLVPLFVRFRFAIPSGHPTTAQADQSNACWQNFKGTLPRKSTWALNVQFSEKTTMVPFI